MRSLSRHVASTPQRNEPGGRGRPRRRGARFDPLHASRGSALAFLLAAAVVALWRADTPFAHGWWLVAYLALVGGCAQLLLGPGREWIATQIGATLPSARWRRWEIGLWNTGTFAVPAGVLTDSASPVLVGSVPADGACPPRRWPGAHSSMGAATGSRVGVSLLRARALSQRQRVHRCRPRRSAALAIARARGEVPCQVALPCAD